MTLYLNIFRREPAITKFDWLSPYPQVIGGVFNLHRSVLPLALYTRLPTLAHGIGSTLGFRGLANKLNFIGTFRTSLFGLPGFIGFHPSLTFGLCSIPQTSARAPILLAKKGQVPVNPVSYYLELRVPEIGFGTGHRWVFQGFFFNFRSSRGFFFHPFPSTGTWFHLIGSREVGILGPWMGGPTHIPSTDFLVFPTYSQGVLTCLQPHY